MRRYRKYHKPVSMIRKTRSQALEDGTLIDLTVYEITREYYRCSVAVTTPVWKFFKKALTTHQYHDNFKGLLRDFFTMAKTRYSEPNPWTRRFSIVVPGMGRKTRYGFKLIIQPEDDGTPAFTIMLPNEH